jgi:hypothetical protein
VGAFAGVGASMVSFSRRPSDLRSCSISPASFASSRSASGACASPVHRAPTPPVRTPFQNRARYPVRFLRRGASLR